MRKRSPSSRGPFPVLDLPRIRTLLVPVDGSPFAEQALPWAAAIGRAAGARLRLALVHQVPSPPPLDESTVKLYTRIEVMLRKSQGEYLARTAERIGREHQLPVAKAVLQGAPAVALGDYVRDVGVDLVVMTTHGLGGIRRAWLGSVAERLVRSLEIPMLLIRPREGAVTSGEALGVSKILVALDGSRRAEAILPPAAAIARLLGAALSLIQVVQPVAMMTDPPTVWPTGFDEELVRLGREQAQEYLDRIVEELNGQGVPASGMAVLGNSPFDAIHEASREPGTGMVALATHGRGGLRRLVVGSVADKLVRGGELPVLVTRPKGRSG